MMRFWLILAGVLVLAGPAWALTKQEIIDLAASGLDDETIVLMIKREGGNLHLTPQEIIELRQAGVSNAVIKAIVELRQPATPRPASTPRPTRRPPPPPSDEPIIIDDPTGEPEPEPVIEDPSPGPVGTAGPATPAVGGGEWETIALDDALSAFVQKKGRWRLEDGALVCGSTSETAAAGSFALTTTQEFGDCEVALDLNYAGPGTFNMRIHYNPRAKDTPAAWQLKISPKTIRGRTVSVVMRVQAGAASATIDGQPAEVTQMGAPGTSGPIQLFVSTRGPCIITNWRVRSL